MTSIKRRLARLEAGTNNSDKYLNPMLSRKVYERMSIEELRAYTYALRRKLNGEEPTREDELILARARTLRKEVLNEHKTAR